MQAVLAEVEMRDLTLRKEIPFESLSKDEVSEMENRLTAELHANNPLVGYNQTLRNVVGVAGV